jgi:poly-beta-1,6-N-acetyl-D-glucosamine synthase
MINLFSDVFADILIVALILQLVMFFTVFSKLAFYRRKKTDTDNLPPVSVIVCAKNEDENLENFLPAVLSQDYPNFEVIVVNDQSVDDTQFVLERIAKENKKLQIVKVEEYINEHTGKKFALTLGIKKAAHEILLLTDADCIPLSNQWIRKMVRNYSDPTEIVIGYSPYKKQPTLLNLFIQFDTFYTALQYFSFGLSGKPYMGVGRNLSYTKTLFFSAKGFSPHFNIPYGDDDLFVNDHSTAENVAIEIDLESFVETLPKKSWMFWLHQKRRHLTTGKIYKQRDKVNLGFVWISQALFYLCLLLALLFTSNYPFILVILGIKVAVTFLIYGMSLKKLDRLYLLFYIIILDPIYQMILLPYISMTKTRLRKQNVW